MSVRLDPLVLTAPGPSGGDMLRSMLQIRSDPLSFLEECWHEHGDVVQFPVPRPPTYLVTHPDGVRTVLQQHHKAYGKDTLQYRNLALVTGNGLLAADTDDWRVQRRQVQPAFTPEAVRAVADAGSAAALRLAREWRERPGAVVDASKAMMRLALEVVGTALLGADLKPESAELAAATQRALEVVVARSRNPLALPTRVPTPVNVALRRAVHRLDEAVGRAVAQRRRHPRPDSSDLLDVLLAVPGITETQLRDQLVTFLVAGHETVASSLAWTWYLLARNPLLADEVAAEAMRAAPDRVLSLDDLPTLRWAEAVVDESLRLYPPGWLVTRKALADDDICGHSVPAGALILISPYLVHRHPAAGSRREVFWPERWLEGQPSPTSCTYIPFGAGPRLCIGRDMARAESALIVATLCRELRIAPESYRPAHPEPKVMLAPRGGVRLVVSPR